MPWNLYICIHVNLCDRHLGGYARHVMYTLYEATSFFSFFSCFFFFIQIVYTDQRSISPSLFFRFRTHMAIRAKEETKCTTIIHVFRRHTFFWFLFLIFRKICWLQCDLVAWYCINKRVSKLWPVSCCTWDFSCYKFFGASPCCYRFVLAVNCSPVIRVYRAYTNTHTLAYTKSIRTHAEAHAIASLDK